MNSIFPADVSVVCGIPLRCELSFKYSEDSKQKKIEEVASAVAEVYARFLTLTNEERQLLSDREVCLSPLSDLRKIRLPSSDKIDDFRKELTAAIIKALNSDSFFDPILDLFIDYGPTKTLGEVCDTVLGSNLFFAFPEKTNTEICLKRKISTLTVSMNFQTRQSSQRALTLNQLSKFKQISIQ